MREIELVKTFSLTCFQILKKNNAWRRIRLASDADIDVETTIKSEFVDNAAHRNKAAQLSLMQKISQVPRTM